MKNKLNIFLLCVIFLLCTVIVFLSCDLYFLYTEKKNEQNIIETEKMIDVPVLCQYPEIPTGCETVSATMVLNYYGVEITISQFATDWLVSSDNFTEYGEEVVGLDPNEFFLGDPFSEYSYGCYAPVIEKAVNENTDTHTAKVIENKTLSELCEEYINNDEPILVWVTQRMQASEKGDSWHLDDGTYFTWIKGEHCMVLVGYNENYYFFNDPMSGGVVAYDKELSQQRFEELGMQALYISEQ